MVLRRRKEPGGQPGIEKSRLLGFAVRVKAEGFFG